MARKPAGLGADVTIVEPVYIEDGCTIARSSIGPNVTLETGTVVEDSTLAHTIVGTKSSVKGSTLKNSLLGDGVVVEGFRGELTVADHSEVRVNYRSTTVTAEVA
jgi:glucose-1-phosphate thymidylyltransferase